MCLLVLCSSTFLPLLIISSLDPFILTQMGCESVVLLVPREASAERLLLRVPVTLGFNAVFCRERVFTLCRRLRLPFTILEMFEITPSARVDNFLPVSSRC